MFIGFLTRDDIDNINVLTLVKLIIRIFSGDGPPRYLAAKFGVTTQRRAMTASSGGEELSNDTPGVTRQILHAIPFACSWKFIR